MRIMFILLFTAIARAHGKNYITDVAVIINYLLTLFYVRSPPEKKYLSFKTACKNAFRRRSRQTTRIVYVRFRVVFV